MISNTGVSAYQQTNKYQKADKAKNAPKSESKSTTKGESSAKVDVKTWSPVDVKSTLVPTKTEYGMTIGDVKLSDAAKDYYEKLKSKYHNLEFIAVSKDMKGQVQQNAAAYGNSSKMVVLIDEEKLERMATDEEYRKKYEGIIASSQAKLIQAKNDLVSSGAVVKNFGMSVDSDGKTSFFATVEKMGEQQKARIEKKQEEKRAKKHEDHKKAEKKAREERIEKMREKNAEGIDAKKAEEPEEEKEYVLFESNSVEELFAKVQQYTYNAASNRVFAEAELSVGGAIDFKG